MVKIKLIFGKYQQIIKLGLSETAEARSKGEREIIFVSDYFFRAQPRFLLYQITAATYATQAMPPTT